MKFASLPFFKFPQMESIPNHLAGSSVKEYIIYSTEALFLILERIALKKSLLFKVEEVMQYERFSFSSLPKLVEAYFQ